MNSISWFLYLSDVIGNIQPVLGIAGAGLIIGAGFCLLVYAVEEWEPGARYARMATFLAVPMILLACIIPSKGTMYAIAASQVGEQLAANEEIKGLAGDAKKALQQWIKRQIGTETKL